MTKESEKLGCKAEAPTNPYLRVDMHCHLLNNLDLDIGSLALRRQLGIDDSDFMVADNLAIAFLNSLATVVKNGSTPISDENGILRAMIRLGQTESIELFCDEVSLLPRQFESSSEGLANLAGGFESRIVNALRLMATFPQIDLFTPSMVDISSDSESQNIKNQIDFYSDLCRATHGRLVPFVSFNPLRAYELELLKVENSYLHWIRYALLERGFIGIKVHPSSGFSPIDNLRYGCLHQDPVFSGESDDDIFERFEAYDRYMQQIFDLCVELDVPLLTHASPSLEISPGCMRRARPEPASRDRGTWRYVHRPEADASQQPLDSYSHWTNSPSQWGKAISEYRRRDRLGRSPRVCLAHLAGGFSDEGHRTYWQQLALQSMQVDPSIFIDISINSNFLTDDGTGGGLGLSRVHAEAFNRVMVDFPRLEYALLYGSDWHMPEATRMGEAYPQVIEQMMDATGIANLKEKVMGQNSMRFLGLEPGMQNRIRLERFLTESGVSLNNVRWMRAR